MNPMRPLAAAALTGLAALSGCASIGGGMAAGGSSVEPLAGYECGQLQVLAGFDGERATLQAGNRTLVLEQVPAASGAKYQSPNNAGTSFWTKGDLALLEVDGRAWPECVALGAVPDTFSAGGNEPFWRVSLAQDQLTFDEPGKTSQAVPYQVQSRQPLGLTLTAELANGPVTLAVERQLCRDSMTGMPHPYQVELNRNGRTLAGCGGDPRQLLQGVEWVVESIDGEGMVDDTRATINFLADDRIAGRASCNRFMGGYEVTGEGLGISRLASTMMACQPEVLAQERRFMGSLEQVRSADFNADGALVLTTTEGGTIRAYPSRSLSQ